MEDDKKSHHFDDDDDNDDNANMWSSAVFDFVVFVGRILSLQNLCLCTVDHIKTVSCLMTWISAEKKLYY